MTPKASRSVEAYWSFTATKPGRSIVLPDGRCDIILHQNAKGADAPIPIVTGPATRAYTVTYDGGDKWLGLRLRPENGHALWQNALATAADTALRGPKACALIPALGNLRGCDMTVDGLAKAVGSIDGVADRRISRAMDALHMSGGRLRIARLAQFVGCTARHLNRMFVAQVGISTKTYAQLVQFHRTLRLVKDETLPISAAAFEGGYADHAHLTRAFKRYGGFTPSQLPQDLSVPNLFPS